METSLDPTARNWLDQLVTAPKKGLFRGRLCPKTYFLDEDFFDWCPAEVFLNRETDRLNVRVTKNGGDYSDFIGAFYGEWRDLPTPAEVTQVNELAAKMSGESIVFIRAFNALAREVNTTAKEKGWWDTERNDGEIIALMHSELSEALEAIRHGNPPDDKIAAFSGAEAELADVVIRIMDMAPARGWRIAEAIVAKMAFNATRERMHGGKKF